MKLDGAHGLDLRAFLRALFALAEPAEPPPPPKDAVVTFIIKPPVRK